MCCLHLTYPRLCVIVSWHAQVAIKFGTRVDDLLVENERVVGVKVSDSVDRLQSSSQKWEYDAVVLAVGHSARDLYQTLLSHNMELIPKDFAVSYFPPFIWSIQRHVYLCLYVWVHE